MEEAKILEKNYGIYGNMRKKFMKAYREADWELLLDADRLDSYLMEINEEFAQKAEQMLPSVLLRHGVVEELKEKDLMGWVQRYNMAQNEVKEVLQQEIETLDVDTSPQENDENSEEDMEPDILPNAKSRFM